MRPWPACIGWPDMIDRVAERVSHRHRKPSLHALNVDLDSINIVVLAVLHIVEKYKNVRSRDLREITKPGGVIRLMNGSDHGSIAFRARANLRRATCSLVVNGENGSSPRILVVSKTRLRR